MNIRDLKYVVAVAEHRNFTRAAEALNVSQPALSSQIKKLERDFGVDIFERRKDGVHLSAFGSKLAKAARHVSSIVDDIEETAQHFRQIDAIPLRLGMPVGLFVNTGERTALSYLTAPLRDRLRRTFIE